MSKRERQSSRSSSSSRGVTLVDGGGHNLGPAPFRRPSRSPPRSGARSPSFSKRRKLKFGSSPNVDRSGTIHSPTTTTSLDRRTQEVRSEAQSQLQLQSQSMSQSPKASISISSSATTSTQTATPTATATMEQLRSLDPKIPSEAQRMKTRFKMIEKGKNTVGYDEYLHRIPKRCRRHIPEHPSTPDHTLDMPNRRWLGQVKAWRKALHQYDPKDLSKVLHAEDPRQKTNETRNDKESEKNDEHPKMKKATLQEREIAQATTRGLQVDFASSEDDAYGNENINENSNSSFKDCTREGDVDMEAWEKEHEENALVDFEEDSDDDLL